MAAAAAAAVVVVAAAAAVVIVAAAAVVAAAVVAVVVVVAAECVGGEGALAPVSSHFPTRISASSFSVHSPSPRSFSSPPCSSFSRFQS